jgi:HEAT repeat protein
MSLFHGTAVQRLESKKDIVGLARLLSSERDPRVRKEAVDALARSGYDGIVELISPMLEDKSFSVCNGASEVLKSVMEGRGETSLPLRVKSAGVLSAHGEKGGTEYLLKVFMNMIEEARSYRLEDYVHVEDTAINANPFLNPRAKEIIRVFKALFRAFTIAGDSMGEVLSQELRNRDNDWYVRMWVIRSLGYTNKKAIKPLLDALVQFSGDRESSFYNDIVSSLKRLGWEPSAGAEKTLYFMITGEWSSIVTMDGADMEILIRALKGGYGETWEGPDINNWSIPMGAAYVLGRLECRKAVEPLVQILRDREKLTTLRQMAAEALGEIGDPRALEALNEAAREDKDRVGRQAGISAAKIKAVFGLDHR